MTLSNSIKATFFLSIMSLFFACSESPMDFDPMPTQGVKSEKVDGFFKYEMDRSLLVKNDEDVEDEVNNEILIDLAEALKSELNEYDVRSEIISLAKENGAGFVPVRVLAERIPAIGHLFPDANSFTSGKNLMMHQEVPHEAVINIPNIDVADASYNPIVSPGIEVEDNPQLGLEDIVFSWILTDAGKYEGIVLGEEQALSSKNPLFMLSPHATEEFMSQNTRSALPAFRTTSDNNDMAGQLKSGINFTMNEYKINYRYEGSGKSEFAMAAIMIAPQGDNSLWMTDDCCYHYVDYKILDTVHKNDIGKELSKWNTISTTDPGFNRDNHFVIWNTFERDWNHSKKFLGDTNAGNHYTQIKGKRKYTSEYYAYNVYDQNVVMRMDLQHIVNTWLQRQFTYKGFINIWRTNG